MTWRIYRDLRAAFYAQIVHDATRVKRIVLTYICVTLISLGLLWGLDTTPTTTEWATSLIQLSFKKIRYAIQGSMVVKQRFDFLTLRGSSGEVWDWSATMPHFNRTWMEAVAVLSFDDRNSSVHTTVTVDGKGMAPSWRDAPSVGDGHFLIGEIVWAVSRAVVTRRRALMEVLSEYRPILYEETFEVVSPGMNPAFYVLLIVVLCWMDISNYLRENDSPFERTLVGHGFASVMQLVRLTFNWTYSSVLTLIIFGLSASFRELDWPLLWTGVSYCAAIQSHILLFSCIFDDAYVANVTSILFWALSSFTSDVLEYADASPSIVYSALFLLPNFALRTSLRYREILHIRRRGQVVLYGNFFRDILDWPFDWATVAMVPVIIIVPLLLLFRHVFARQDTRYATLEGDGIMRLDSVGQRFGKVRVFDSVNLDIGCFERVVLEGANGSGKSTLLNIMASGKCSDGIVAARNGLVVRMCSQATRLEDHLTAYQHLKTVLLLGERGAFDFDTRITDLCTRLGIPKDVPAGKMSGGQRRKLLVAMAIATPCGLLLLDEPTNNIDVDSRCTIWNFLVMLMCTTMVIATHDVTEAKILSTRRCRVKMVRDRSVVLEKQMLPQRFQLSAISPSRLISELLEKWRTRDNYRVRNNTEHVLFHLRCSEDADGMDKLLERASELSREDNTTSLLQLKSVPRREFPENPLNERTYIDVDAYPKYIEQFERRSGNFVRSVWGLLVLRADYEFLRACATAKIFLLLAVILLCGTLLVCIVRAPITQVDIGLGQLVKPAFVLVNITRPQNYKLVKVCAAIMERIHGELLFRESITSDDFYRHNIIGGLAMYDIAVGQNITSENFMETIYFFSVAHRAYSLESMIILRERIWEAFIQIYRLGESEITHVDPTFTFKLGPGLVEPVGAERFDVAIVTILLYICLSFVIPLRHAVDEQTSQFREFLLRLGVLRLVMLLADLIVDSLILCVATGGLILFEHFCGLALGGWALFPMLVAQLPFVYVWSKFTTQAIGHFFVAYVVALPVTVIARIVCGWWKHVDIIVAIFDSFVPPLSLGHWLWERTHFAVFSGNESVHSIVCSEWSTLAFSQCCRLYDERHGNITNGTVQPCIDDIQFWTHEANLLIVVQLAVASIVFFGSLYVSCRYCSYILKKLLRRYTPSSSGLLDVDCIEAFVSKARGGKCILNACEFAVEPRTHALLVGPNGVGKSTLMEILAGRLSASSGNPRLVLDGRVYRPHHRHYEENVTYMRQENFINPWQSTGLVVKVLGDILNIDSMVGRKLVHALNIPNLPVFAQSGGNQRKLCLILSMLTPNRVLIFDEPLVGADKASRLVFFKLLVALRERDRIVISSSHTPRDTLNMDVQSWKMHGGKVRLVQRRVQETDYIIVLLFQSSEACMEWMEIARHDEMSIVNTKFSLGLCVLALILRSRQPTRDLIRLSQKAQRPYKECTIVPAQFAHTVV